MGWGVQRSVTWVVLAGGPMEGMAVLYAGDCEEQARRVAANEHSGLRELLRWAHEEVDQDGSFAPQQLGDEVHIQQWVGGLRLGVEAFSVQYAGGTT
jgi:hypothetical protein